jgi:CheY-like chemotaxis protein
MNRLEGSPQPPTTPTPVEMVNKALQELGSTTKWKRAPEFLPEYGPLKDKTLVMIDDVREILESFAPHLVVATDGKASFIHFTDQSLDDLIDQIAQSNPNLVIVDFHLSSDFKGTAIVQALNKRGFAGDVIGFSSDKSAVREFREAGATGVVNKNAGYPEESVTQLAEVIREYP